MGGREEVTAEGGRLQYPQQHLPPEGAEIRNLTTAYSFQVSHSNRKGYKYLEKNLTMNQNTV